MFGFDSEVMQLFSSREPGGNRLEAEWRAKRLSVILDPEGVFFSFSSMLERAVTFEAILSAPNWLSIWSLDGYRDNEIMGCGV